MLRTLLLLLTMHLLHSCLAKQQDTDDPDGVASLEELAELHEGCFQDNPESRDLERRMSGDLNSIDKCIKACSIGYYKYAGST